MNVDDSPIETRDGVRLEWSAAMPEEPRAVTVLTHPHPAYGGDMHALVPAALASMLPSAGIGAVRFNFRGVGDSTGEHDGGQGEQLDLCAVIEHVATRLPALPIVVVGYSFGAEVAASVDAVRAAGRVLIAAPLRSTDVTPPSGDRPVLVLVPEHDQFSSPERTRARVEEWPDTRVAVIDGGDHFLAASMPEVASAVVAFVDGLL